MSKKVKVEDLDRELAKVFAQYTEEICEKVAAIADEVSRDCLADVVAAAPERSGGYKKGFAREIKKTGSGATYAIWNKKHYNRVHLLEHGHAKIGGGRVPGVPHMGPAEIRAAEKLERRVEQAIREGG